MRDGRAIVTEFLSCWTRLDLEDALSRLTDAAIFQPDPKAEPVCGRDAIRKLWSAYMKAIRKYDVSVRAAVAGGRFVFVERVERLAVGGDRELILPIVGVFEIDDAGKISAWRDYWDPAMAGAH